MFTARGEDGSTRDIVSSLVPCEHTRVCMCVYICVCVCTAVFTTQTSDVGSQAKKQRGESLHDGDVYASATRMDPKTRGCKACIKIMCKEDIRANTRVDECHMRVVSPTAVLRGRMSRGTATAAST